MSNLPKHLIRIKIEKINDKWIYVREYIDNKGLRHTDENVAVAILLSGTVQTTSGIGLIPTTTFENLDDLDGMTNEC